MTAAIISMFLLPDFPHNTRWLSAEERELAQRRLAQDASEVGCHIAQGKLIRKLSHTLFYTSSGRRR
jgi:hypothetical protein